MALDRRYVEHDSYTLFCFVMKAAKSFFLTNDHIRSPEKKVEKQQQKPVNSIFGDNAKPFVTHSTAPTPTPANLDIPLIAKCDRIQNVWLKKMSRDLWKHLKTLDIEPQLYGLYVIELSIDSVNRI